MDTARIEFLFGEVPPGVDVDNPQVRAELLGRHPYPGESMQAYREQVASQIADDQPPEVWQTVLRLLECAIPPGEIMEQVVVALRQASQQAISEERAVDLAAFVESLEALPLPTAETVTELLIGLVRAQPGILVDDLSREILRTTGRAQDDNLALEVFDRINERLVEPGGPLAWLADDQTVHVGDLVAGRVLTHRLEAPERDTEVLDPFDLIGFDRLAPLHLADGQPVELLPFGYDPPAWSGPPGWLNGFDAGSLLAVRVVTGGLVSIEPIPDPLPDPGLVERLRAVYLHAVEESQLPASLEQIALSLMLADPLAFTEAQLPLGELCRAAGLERRGAEVAHDSQLWANARQLAMLGRLMDTFEDDQERNAAMRALDAAEDPQVSPQMLREVLQGLRSAEVLDFLAAEMLDPDDEVGLEEARAFSQRLLRAARRPAERAVAGWWAALVAERSGRPLDAESELRSAVEADPSWEPAVERLGWYAYERGDAAQAVQLWSRLEEPPDPDLEVAEQFAARRPEHRLGRNEACWCGSGRKYKACHLERPELAPLPDRARWLYRKAVAYLERAGEAAAQDLISLAEAVAVDESEAALSEAFDDPVIPEAALVEGGWFERFLEERGSLLPEDERSLAGTWTQVERTVYEVVESNGAGTQLRDVRTGSRLAVRSGVLGEGIQPGYRLCARALPDGESHQIFGSIFPVAPGAEDEILEMCRAGVPELTCLVAATSRRTVTAGGPVDRRSEQPAGLAGPASRRDDG